VIRFRSFTKTFGAQTAVREVSFEAAPGEVIVLLGPNGSGKTTTLKAAAGLIHPTSGDVLVGEPALPATAAAARLSCSFLPQRVSFPEAMTGGEVAEFYASLRGVSSSRVHQVLRRVALDEAAGRPVGTYSGGMVQRLGLAVALLPDAPVLLLDEPTAALDPDGLAVFFEVVEDMKRAGRTVLFTTHQLSELEHLADRVAVLVMGRLVALLSTRELREQLPDAGPLRLHRFYRERTRECAA
jgi:Cu-processing system ATP-binding protein